MWVNQITPQQTPLRLVVKMDWDRRLRGGRLKRFLRRVALVFFSRFCDFMIVESREALFNAVREIPRLAVGLGLFIMAIVMS